MYSLTMTLGLWVHSSVSRAATASTSLGEPASRAWAMWGRVRAPHSTRFARGTGRTGAPSPSTLGRRRTRVRSRSQAASPRAVGVRAGRPSLQQYHKMARRLSRRTHSRMPTAHTRVSGPSFFMSLRRWMSWRE